MGVVVVAQHESGGDVRREQKREEHQDHAPESRGRGARAVRDAQVREQVQCQIAHAREGDLRVARREALHGVVDPRIVARADVVDGVHEAVEAFAPHPRRYHGLADRQEMRAQAADGFLDDDLEAGPCDEAVQEAQDRRRAVGEGLYPELGEDDHGERDRCAEDAREERGEDGCAIWVRDGRVVGKWEESWRPCMDDPDLNTRLLR